MKRGTKLFFQQFQQYYRLAIDKPYAIFANFINLKMNAKGKKECLFLGKPAKPSYL